MYDLQFLKESPMKLITVNINVISEKNHHFKGGASSQNEFTCLFLWVPLYKVIFLYGNLLIINTQFDQDFRTETYLKDTKCFV